MVKLYFLFLQIFVVVQIIKGESSTDLTTIEVLSSPTTPAAGMSTIERAATTEGGATAPRMSTIEGPATTEGGATAPRMSTIEGPATTEGGATAPRISTIEGATTTAGSTQPITTKTTLSGVKTTPENVNKGAQLLFTCNANTCTFEFIVPELLLRHVDPNQLQQTIGLLSDQISSVKTELDLAKINETTYSEDINDWINKVNETEADLKADIAVLTLNNTYVNQQVTDISNKAEAYLKSALCFAGGSLSLSCSPYNFLPTTTATFTTESTADSV